MAREILPFSWSGDTLAADALLRYVRRVPDHPLKTRLVNRCLKHGFTHGMRVSSPRGAKLSIDVNDFIGARIVREGAYEPKSLARALSVMSDGGVFVDIGANFGLYTCTVGSLEGVRCIAVDASARAFSALQKNVELNTALNVDLVNVALAAAPGVRGLVLPRSDNLGMTRVEESEDATSFVGSLTLSNLLEFFRPDGIRLLKIDVEGYELEVFRGLDWDGPFRPMHVIMEFTDQIRTTSQTTRECLGFLRERGYEAFTVDGAPYRDETEVPEDNLWFSSTGGRG